MGRKVRKTLNIDAAKLKRVQRSLGLETEVIDHMLNDFDFERELAEVLRNASPTWKTFRSPLVSRP